MVTLNIDNVSLKIINLGREDELDLWSLLSFRVEVFGSLDVYYRHLYNRKTKKTYTGLLPYVIEFLKTNDINYQIVDNRIKCEQNANFKLVNYIDNKHKVKLIARPYQQKIIDNCSHRAIIQAATGAGKTFIMAALIAKFNVKPVCVFADKTTLCSQLKSEFEKFLGVEVGLVGGGVKEYRDITVISLQSAEEEYIRNAKLCMWDECLPGNAKVMNGNGEYVTISNIVENKCEQMVMSYNMLTNAFEPKEILNYWKKPIQNRKMMKIIIKKYDKTLIIIECTNNHKIWINNEQKYIRADELIYGQNVLIYDDIPEIGIIKSIEYVNTLEKYVYDIEVKDNHNFITNNVVVSNCHHIPAKTTVEVADKCISAYYRIGVSATPWRDAGDDMLIEAVLSKKNPNNNINASKLIQLGYLVKPKIFFVPVFEVFKGKNYNDIYNKAIVDNVKRNKMIYKITYQMHKINRKVLILVKNIKHGEKIKNDLSKFLGTKSSNVKVINQKNGKETIIRVHNIEFLSGSDNALKRSAVIEGVKQGICQVLIASTIADEGLDLPILDTLILAGSGKSSTRAFQRIGRVLRLYVDKKTGKSKTNAYVFDFIDYTPMLKKHSKIRCKLYKQEKEWEIQEEFNVTV